VLGALCGGCLDCAYIAFRIIKGFLGMRAMQKQAAESAGLNG
jgi:hypothetical protein